MNITTLLVNFKRLTPNAKIPTYAHSEDAGMDLVATEVESLESVDGSNGYIIAKTGLAVEIPNGYVGLIFPRGSISNTCLSLANAVGVIDPGYTGEITFRFRVLEAGWGSYNAGDKIGQLVVLPFPKIQPVEVKEFAHSQRGHGAYGSTGQ